MSRNLPLPYFPVPPGQYTQRYFAELIRAFGIALEQIQNPGQGRNTFTVFTNLQSDDYGLELGTIFEHGGYVKVSLINSPNVRGQSAIGSVGAVTVLTV